MNTRAALVWLAVAAVMAALAVVALRPGGAGKGALGGGVLLDVPSDRVTGLEIRVAATGGNAESAAELAWSAEVGAWLIRVDGSPAWPTEPERASALLRLLREKTVETTGPVSGELGSAATPHELRMKIGSDERVLRFSSDVVGGKALGRLARAGTPEVGVLLPADLAAVLTGVATWRHRSLIAAGLDDADMAEVRGGDAVSLRRSGGSWSMTRPMVTRADDESVRQWIDRLLRLDTAGGEGFGAGSGAGEPSRVIELSAERVRFEGDAAVRDRLVQRVEVREAGEWAELVSMASWVSPGREPRVLWGPAYGRVPRDAAAGLLPTAELLASRRVLALAASDVRVVMATAEGGETRRWERGLEGWVGGGGSGDFGGVFEWMTSGRAAAVLREDPDGVRWLGTVRAGPNEEVGEELRIGVRGAAVVVRAGPRVLVFDDEAARRAAAVLFAGADLGGAG